MVRSLPAMQETRVGSLGQEDPLEKGKERKKRLTVSKTTVQLDSTNNNIPVGGGATGIFLHYS